MDIQAITIMLNKACNLHCDYCFINKECGTNAIDKELVMLAKSDYYIDILKEDYTSDELSKIHKLDFWGGEPTLNYEEIISLTTRISDICPIYMVSISTNLSLPDAADRIIAIYRNMAEIGKKKNYDKPLMFSVQVSIDGSPLINDRNRGNNVSMMVSQNMRNLVDKIKSVYQPDYCILHTHAHCVYDSDTVEMLSNKDMLIENYRYFYNVDKYIQEANVDRLESKFTPGISTMFMAAETKTTGKNMAKLLNTMYDFFVEKNPSKYGFSRKFFDDIYAYFPGYGEFRFKSLGRPHKFKSIDDEWKAILYDEQEIRTHDISGTPEEHTYCGNCFSTRLIAPDKEYALCQNCFYDRYNSYQDGFTDINIPNTRFIKNENADYKKLSSLWIWRTEEEHKKFCKVVDNAYSNIRDGGYYGNETLARTMIRTMARCGVIDPKYEDHKECNYAAKHICLNSTCMSHLLTLTGSINVPALYQVVLWLNGALDQADKIFLLRLEREKKARRFECYRKKVLYE